MAYTGADSEVVFGTAIEYLTANKEYKEFIKFIKDAPEQIKSELRSLLYPFYVYVYLILLQSKKIKEGQQFLSSYMRLFSNAEGYENVIKTLREFKHSHELKNHSYFKQFCESKYVVIFSEDSTSQLRSFFEEIDSEILLPIFRLHVHVKRKCVQNYSETSLWDPDFAYKNFGLSSESPESELSKLKNVLKTMKRSSICKPVIYTYKILSGKKNLCTVDINFDSTQLACGFENSEIHLWNLSSNFLKVERRGMESFFMKTDSDELKEFLASDISIEKVSNPSSNRLLRGHSGSVFGIATTPNNRFLVSCSEDCTAKVWNMENLESVSTYSGHNHPVWDIAVSPDSSYFATASKDARMWSFEDNLPLRVFVGHFDNIDCITFHPNSRYIATTSVDKTIRLWTTEDGREVRIFSGHTTFISSIVFSPNGKLLASSDDDGYVKIWDLSSGLAISEFKAHYSRILSMSFNRSGTLLATGGFDKYLKVWDAQFQIGEETYAVSPDKKMQKEALPKLVDSHFMDAKLHRVKFCRKGLLLSVTSSINTDS